MKRQLCAMTVFLCTSFCRGAKALQLLRCTARTKDSSSELRFRFTNHQEFTQVRIAVRRARIGCVFSMMGGKTRSRQCPGFSVAKVSIKWKCFCILEVSFAQLSRYWCNSKKPWRILRDRKFHCEEQRWIHGCLCQGWARLKS